MKNCLVLFRTFTQVNGKMLLRFTVRNRECWRWRVCLVSKRNLVWEISYKSRYCCSVSFKILYFLLQGHYRKIRTGLTYNPIWWLGFTCCSACAFLVNTSYVFLLRENFLVGWLVGWFQHTRKKYFPQPRFPNQAVLCLICTQGDTTVLHGAVFPWPAGGAQGCCSWAQQKLGPTLPCNS